MWTLILTIFIAGHGVVLETREGFNSYRSCTDEGKEWLEPLKDARDYGVFFTAGADCKELA